MFGQNDPSEVYQNNFIMAQKAGAQNEEYNRQYFENKVQTPFHKSNWIGLSPLNKENQIHYQKIWNRSTSDNESDGCPQSKSGPGSSHKRKRKRKRNSQVAENSSKRVRGQSQIVEMFTPQHQSIRQHSKEGQGREYSTHMKPPFQDRRLERDIQGYGVMNISAGHYSHTEFQLPPPPPAQSNSRASSWLGPDIPNGEKWGSTESGGFGEMFPPGTPFEYHKSAQQQSHSNQIRHDSNHFSGAQVEKFNVVRGSVQGSFEKPPRRQEDMMASDVHSIYCLPETIDLTTPESAQSRRKVTQMSTISGSSRNKRGLETEPTEVDDWDSDIQDYKSARMQSYVPFGSTESDAPDVTHPKHRVMNTLHGNGNGYPSQYTEYYNGGKHHSNAMEPSKLIRKKHSASMVPANSYTVLRPSDFHPEVKVHNSHNHNIHLGESLPHRIRKASQGLDDNSRKVHGAIDYSSEYESSDTMEEMLRKQRPQKENSAVKDIRDVSLKPSNIISNSEEESNISTLLKIRSSKNSKAIGHLQVENISPVVANGDASRHITIKKTAANLANEIEKGEEQRRQKLAAETIAQREKKAETSHSVEALFEEEEETIDEVKLARIKRAKEVDKMKRQLKEDARIVEEGSRLTQEKLESARKMREADDLEERRAEKMRRVEEKRRLDSKKEEERLNAKRRIATQALKLQRLQDEEARNEVLNKLRAERVASKKRAAALQAFKKSDRSPTSIEDVAQLEHPKLAEESDTMSNGGMFVPGNDSPFPDVEPIERSSNDDNKRNVESSPTHQAERISVEASHAIETEQPSETTLLGEDSTVRPSDIVDTSSALPAKVTTSSEDSRNISDNDQSTVLTSDISKTQLTTNGVDEIPVVPSSWQKPIVATVRTGEDSITSAAQMNMSKVVIMIDEVDHLSNSTKTRVEKQAHTTVVKKSVQNKTATSMRKPQVSSSHIAGLSISTLASDGRRRPPELARQKPARAQSPDPIRFTSKGRTTSQRSREAELKSIFSQSTARKKPLDELMHNPDSQTEAKLQKILKDVENLTAKIQANDAQQKKEWDDRMKQLNTVNVSKNLQGSHEKIHSQTSDAGKNGHLSSATSQSKYPSLTSQINFVSAIEAKEREKKKLEEARLAKFEKDKAGCRRRYDREIRTILAGQGIDQDEEKISKQLDEKMTAWEEKRRKKARRESGDKDLSYSRGQDGVLQSETEHDSGSLQVIPSAEGEKPQELQTIGSDKDEAMRAGVKFLASQYKGGNEFSKAASKSRIEEFESDESEEDPDDEPDTLADQLEQVANITPEESERVDGVEVDLTLNPAALKASIIPPLPEIPEQRKASTAFFPDIVNPKEEDIIHSYSVRHRASRENNVFDSVVLGSFHSREEANEFARHKLAEFNLGPATGKSETHDEDNLYIGEVTTNKEENHSETIWVTRDIVYIGDTANVKRSDIKAIIPAKVYNVLQIAQPEKEDSNDDKDISPVGTIIATVTIKSLANKKAADHFLAMMKPTRPRIDSMAFYNDTVIPSVRESLAAAEEQDLTVDLEGLIPDTERAFSIIISENTVMGPLN